MRVSVMSGPKTSRYTLTAEQRRIIMEQRRIQLETELLQKKISEVHSNISRRISVLDSQLEEMESVLKEVGEDFELFDNLKSLRNQAMEIAVESNCVVKQTNLEVLRKTSGKLQRIYVKLQDESNRVFSVYSKKEEEYRASIEKTIDDGFETSFFDLGIQKEEQDNGCRDKVENTLEKILVMHLSDDLKRKYEQIEKKVSEIDDVDFLTNYYSVTIQPFMKECLDSDRLYQQIGEEFELLKETYVLLCEKAAIKPEDISYSYSGIEILKSKINELEELALQQEEEIYINECIDETMREMGYDLIGERHIRKKNGSKFTKELYLFEEGTAVNVTYASNGQITMELGGIDETDRIPTKEECIQLTQNMRNFCDDYYEIEKRLRKKGVITKRISILPAEEQFAQIINVSDYEMNTEVSSFEVRSSRRKNATNKVLHKEV